MGTPNNLGFILEGWLVKGGEITPEEWCQIIQKALNLLRASLRYISSCEFKPIAEFTNVRPNIVKHEDAFETVVTDRRVITYSDGIVPQMKCAFVAQTQDTVISEDRKNFEERYLLVTQKCKLVLWHYAWRGHSTGGKEIFKCSFSAVSTDLLATLIRNHQYGNCMSYMIQYSLQYQIVQRIVKLIDDAVSKKLAAVEKAKQPMEQLKLIRSRIIPNP
jgi:hypothetical protein